MSVRWAILVGKRRAETALRKRPPTSNPPNAILAGLASAAILLASAPETNARQMVPVFDEPRIVTASLSVVGPLVRPDPALSLPLAPASMTVPLARPDIEDRLPATLLTLEEEFAEMTGAAPGTAAETYTLRSGEGMAQLLQRGGIHPDSVQDAIGRISGHLSMRSLPVGFEVAILPAGENHGAALRLPLEDDMTLSLVHHGPGDWAQRLSLRPVERYMYYSYGSIDSSLYQAGKDAGITDDVFNTFVSVLGFTVDFQREVRKGDEFEVIYETSYDMISGKVRSEPELSYLSMNLSGDLIEFFRHEHLDGDFGWYDREGKSAARGLMRTPVNGARLSSGFGTRKHPILGYSKMHRGADFAAPTGTPIMAAGSGVVEYSGRNGNYGNYVRIRHSGTYKTAYAHLSRIHVSSGSRVSQGQIIGTVGSTGRSTGPHLHYEIIVNDRQVNPLTVKLPAGKSMPDLERPRFADTLERVSDELGARGIIRFASGE